MKRFMNSLALGVVFSAVSVLAFSGTDAGVLKAQTFSSHETPQDIPAVISYQGMLLSRDGQPVTGEKSVTVRMYSDAEGTQVVWEDTYRVQVEQGMVNLQLGSNRPLPKVSSLSGALYVGVQMEQESEMRPLTQLTSVPYAMNVADGAVTRAKMGTDYVGAISINGKKVTEKGSDVNFVAGNGLSMAYDPVGNAVVLKSDGISQIGREMNGTLATTTIAGDLVVKGSTDLGGGAANTTIKFRSKAATNLDMAGYVVQNIGNAGTDFQTNGGLTLANALAVTTGGASISGGLNLNSGGISQTGEISGVTGLTFAPSDIEEFPYRMITSAQAEAGYHGTTLLLKGGAADEDFYGGSIFLNAANATGKGGGGFVGLRSGNDESAFGAVVFASGAVDGISGSVYLQTDDHIRVDIHPDGEVNLRENPLTNVGSLSVIGDVDLGDGTGAEINVGGSAADALNFKGTLGSNLNMGGHSLTNTDSLIFSASPDNDGVRVITTAKAAPGDLGANIVLMAGQADADQNAGNVGVVGGTATGNASGGIALFASGASGDNFGAGLYAWGATPTQHGKLWTLTGGVVRQNISADGVFDYNGSDLTKIGSLSVDGNVDLGDGTGAEISLGADADDIINFNGKAGSDLDLSGHDLQNAGDIILSKSPGQINFHDITAAPSGSSEDGTSIRIHATDGGVNKRPGFAALVAGDATGTFSGGQAVLAAGAADGGVGASIVANGASSTEDGTLVFKTAGMARMEISENGTFDLYDNSLNLAGTLVANGNVDLGNGGGDQVNIGADADDDIYFNGHAESDLDMNGHSILNTGAIGDLTGVTGIEFAENGEGYRQISVADALGTDNGTALRVVGGKAGDSDASGGSVEIDGGEGGPDGSGGNVELNGGVAVDATGGRLAILGGYAGNGGGVQMSGGFVNTEGGTGGRLSLNGGDDVTQVLGSGGDVEIDGGRAHGLGQNAGDVYLRGGSADNANGLPNTSGNGGDVTVAAGHGLVGGSVHITSGEGTTDGKIELSTGNDVRMRISSDGGVDLLSNDLVGVNALDVAGTTTLNGDVNLGDDDSRTINVGGGESDVVNILGKIGSDIDMDGHSFINANGDLDEVSRITFAADGDATIQLADTEDGDAQQLTFEGSEAPEGFESGGFDFYAADGSGTGGAGGVIYFQAGGADGGTGAQVTLRAGKESEPGKLQLEGGWSQIDGVPGGEITLEGGRGIGTGDGSGTDGGLVTIKGGRGLGIANTGGTVTIRGGAGNHLPGGSSPDDDAAGGDVSIEGGTGGAADGSVFIVTDDVQRISVTSDGTTSASGHVILGDGDGDHINLGFNANDEIYFNGYTRTDLDMNNNAINNAKLGSLSGLTFAAYINNYRVIDADPVTGSDNGTGIRIISGSASSFNQTGGNLELLAAEGTGSGHGGNIRLVGGMATGGYGGSMTVQPATEDNPGGIEMYGGDSQLEGIEAASVHLQGGAGFDYGIGGRGGDVELVGGTGRGDTYRGGDVRISGGEGLGADGGDPGFGGDVSITAGEGDAGDGSISISTAGEQRILITEEGAIEFNGSKLTDIGELLVNGDVTLGSGDGSTIDIGQSDDDGINFYGLATSDLDMNGQSIANVANLTNVGSLSFTGVPGDIEITVEEATTGDNGNNLRFYAGTSPTDDAVGGLIELNAANGAGTGDAGSVFLNAGEAYGGTGAFLKLWGGYDDAGGEVRLEAGHSYVDGTPGADIELEAGKGFGAEDGAGADGGNVTIAGGTSYGETHTGGTVSIRGGQADHVTSNPNDGYGGNVSIEGGMGSAGNGNVILATSNTQRLTIDDAGNIALYGNVSLGENVGRTINIGGGENDEVHFNAVAASNLDMGGKSITNLNNITPTKLLGASTHSGSSSGDAYAEVYTVSAGTTGVGSPTITINNQYVSAASVVIVTPASASAGAPVLYVTPGSQQFTITGSGNWGAGAIIHYIIVSP